MGTLNRLFVVSLFGICGVATLHAKTSNIKIDGYVTAINSTTSFEIEDYRITRDSAFKLEFDNPSPDLSFKLEDLKVGTELEIKGVYEDQTGELTATSIKVDMEQFRKLNDTAVLERSPDGLQQVDGEWKGVFFANGQTIQVTPDTKVVFKLTSREKKEEKATKEKGGTADSSRQDDFRPLTSLADVTPGMFMTYEGKRDVETGRILADRVEFLKNDFERGEEQIWKQLKIDVKTFNITSSKPSELKISGVGKFKLLPNDEVQAYVTKIGESLIPEYLRAVPDSDPSKLHFRFFVVIDKEPNAFALPNGVFVVHSGMFDVVENEAQLAAVIGHEIAHATQEHTWRQMNYHKNALLAVSIASAFAGVFGGTNLQQIGNMVVGAVRSGYSRALENQADRVGLKYMAQAGYDPREAPQLWKQMTKTYGLQGTNVFWSTHDNQATRRSYLMNEIKNNYSETNFSESRRNGDSFDRMKAVVKDTVSGKKTIKVKG